MSKLALFSTLVFILFVGKTYSQLSNGYWQQHVSYDMSVNMDVTTHQFQGKQKLVYTNNSPDTLKKVFYHLYFNAFQPGSMMDIRSLTIADPDSRVGSRISKLSDKEIGYQHIISLKQNGKDISYKVSGTILEVWLKEPLFPGQNTTLQMEFNGQVPVQIRRSGRDNAEGVAYSMSQWYPKLCEYDYMGWHPTPYVAREFYGVWGDFDVSITIDPTYTLGGTGYLQNPDEVGHGYESEGKSVKVSDKPLTWHFKAPNIHDFMWAADPEYNHTTLQVPDGPLLHFIYKNTPDIQDSWEKLPEIMSRAMQFASKNFGKYPFKEYSFVQGGDGGMEYPMATLITGGRNLKGLISVAVHEMLHSWYQGVLATNESLYPWMDEGFTTFATGLTIQYLQNPDSDKNPNARSYTSYLAMAGSGDEEPLTTHSDMYHTNRSYSINAYSKGAVFLAQLGYVIGEENLMNGLKRYFYDWKFKHPTPVDLIRAMEKTSGMQLDWYLENFVNTTNKIDYSVGDINESNGATFVTLERKANMMMPVDLYIEYADGSREILYIPLRIMHGEKPVEDENIQRTTLDPWPWTYPTYTIRINRPLSEIKSVVIDKTNRMADINPDNNSYESINILPFHDPTK